MKRKRAVTCFRVERGAIDRRRRGGLWESLVAGLGAVTGSIFLHACRLSSRAHHISIETPVSAAAGIQKEIN